MKPSFRPVLIITIAGIIFLSPLKRAEPDSRDRFSSVIWGYFEKLCSFGPRNPGSAGYREAIQFIKRMGIRFADEVIEHPFEVLQSNGRRVKLVNLEFRFRGTEEGKPLLIGTHFDTRPFADEESDPNLHAVPIPGANDGGSGSAVLLGLAEYLKENRLRRSVHLVFFDGEDLGVKGSGENLLGSFYYSQQLETRDPEDWPFGVIIIDMVGDKDLNIYKETQSLKSGPWLLDAVYHVAKREGFPQFLEQSKYTIYDDHYPFFKLGIPSILLIDFDYPYWHTLQDTLDKCSPESLFAVFAVVVGALDEI